MGETADVQPFDFIVVGGEFPLPCDLFLQHVTKTKQVELQETPSPAA